MMAQELLSMNTNGEPSGKVRDNGIVVNGGASDKDDTLSKVKVVKKPTLNLLSIPGMTKANNMVRSYFLGMDDADYNYRAKKAATTTIFVTTLIGGPLVGLIPAVACSAKAPSNRNLDVPTSGLVTDDAYMRGYKCEASYIKKHSTWPRYVLASVIWVAVAGFILR